MSDDNIEVYFDDELYEEGSLAHYGTAHVGYTPHSGRYRWGSGENAHQRRGGFVDHVNELKKEGLSQKEIAKMFNMTTTELRAKISADNAANMKAMDSAVYRIYDSGITSPSEIAKRLGKNESSIRTILKRRGKAQFDILNNTKDALKNSVEKYGFVDVGKGVEQYLGVSQDRLKKASEQLALDGYVIESMQVKQASTNNFTPMRILAKPGTTRKEILEAIKSGEVKLPFEYSQDGGETFVQRGPIQNIDSSRIFIRYGDKGGADRDGTIEIRRGVPDLNLGQAHYAQVRVGVDGVSYLKGMAFYSNDIPPGYDIVYNTNKKTGTPPYKVFKDQEGVKNGVRIAEPKDPSNPFGASLKYEDKLSYIQRYYTDEKGKTHQSALNIVNEEGSVGEWKKTLASQFLSKQTPELAKKQLKLDADIRKSEFDEIMSLTNPVVKEKLLRSFADECDSAAVHLAAAALPRQRSHYILPFPEMKDNEVYAPHYKDGEEVILVRYPHEGIYQIPRLTVNNRVKSAKEAIGNARDAIGINSKVAEQLSGADFDGDTVLVIPTKGYNIKTHAPLEGLIKFDTKSYKIPDELKDTPENRAAGRTGLIHLMTKKERNQEMGKASNLITDMTIKGASFEELERATRYSMTVIDAYKHELDYKQCFVDNAIGALKTKYQGGPDRGASTLISRTTSDEYVPKRKSYYDIDKETGAKIFKPVSSEEATYYKPKKKTNKETGEEEIVGWKETKSQTKSTKGYEHDPYELVSEGGGTQIERVYADYARDMKALGDKARLESTRTGKLPQNKEAKVVYKKEVDSLMSKLSIAEKNAPLERQAQLLAGKTVEMMKQDNPELKNDPEALKKKKNQAIVNARLAVGAKKNLIDITDKEWEAIQAGAITKNKLESIIANADEKRVKELSMPKKSNKTSESTEIKIRQLDRQGLTISEIADLTGLSTDTISKVL